MTSEELQKYIGIHQGTLRRVYSQRAYYDGVHPAIYADAAKEAPDNRIPVPFPRKAVRFLLGYMFKPGNIVYSGDFYESTLKDVFNANEESILTSELAESALIHGRAFELHWTDGGMERFAQVPAIQGFMVKSEDIIPRNIAFIRHWIDSDGNSHAWTYDEQYATEWQMGRDGWAQAGQMLHGYRTVPVVEFAIDSAWRNLYDHALPLVDWHDKVISEDFANELERFANSYLLLSADIDGTTVDSSGETEVDKIKRTRIFANLRENVQTAVSFLTKQVNDGFVGNAADRAERLIYETIGIPNPNDETFAATSGIALAYKLLPLEYLCSAIETYFSRGLQQRIRLIGNLDATINGGSDGVDEVTIRWQRSLPFDTQATAQTAQMLKGILSDETILKLFPSSIVPDVEEELEKLNEVSDFETAVDEEPVQEEAASAETAQAAT